MSIRWTESDPSLTESDDIVERQRIDNKRQIGGDYETVASEYLVNKGYTIVQINYRVRQAEIDIIAMDGRTIVFVEVKYRANIGSGHPLEAVDVRKQRRICRAALEYLMRNKISIDNTSIRFDVIGILGKEITHVENAFEYIG